MSRPIGVAEEQRTVVDQTELRRDHVVGSLELLDHVQSDTVEQVIEALSVMDLGTPATVIGEEHDPQRSVSRVPVPATEVDQPSVEFDEELDHVRVPVDVHETVGCSHVGHEHLAGRSEHLTLDLVHRVAGGSPWRRVVGDLGHQAALRQVEELEPRRNRRRVAEELAAHCRVDRRVEMPDLITEGRRRTKGQEQRRERERASRSGTVRQLPTAAPNPRTPRDGRPPATTRKGTASRAISSVLGSGSVTEAGMRCSVSDSSICSGPRSLG